MKRSERCCGNCVYFDGKLGHCNRRSLVDVIMVESEYWCGEHATEEEYEKEHPGKERDMARVLKGRCPACNMGGLLRASVSSVHLVACPVCDWCMKETVEGW